MNTVSREIRRNYRDPLDAIWLGTARRIGWTVERSPEVFAAYDGRGTLTLSTTEFFDADDCLAQMILHELCHALVAGPAALQLPDMGLDNTTDRDRISEHATQRLQAALAHRHGLREFFAVTTDHRPYFDALPSNPLADCEDPALSPARIAFERATQGPWAEPIEAALVATALIVEAARPFCTADSLFAADD